MYAQMEKSKENKSRSVANSVAQKQISSKSAFQFEDNRHEAIQMKKLHEMANNSPQEKHIAQLQAVNNNLSSIQEQSLIQRTISKTNIVNDDDSRTGKMSHTFQWVATDEHANGYIVQHIKTENVIHSGDIEPIEYEDYWEAWRVSNSKILGGIPSYNAIAQKLEIKEGELGSAQHDSWKKPEYNGCGTGTIKMTGTVYFTTDDVSQEMAFGSIPEAGTLLSSKGKPSVNLTKIFEGVHSLDWDNTSKEDSISEIEEEEEFFSESEEEEDFVRMVKLRDIYPNYDTKTFNPQTAGAKMLRDLGNVIIPSNTPANQMTYVAMAKRAQAMAQVYYSK